MEIEREKKFALSRRNSENLVKIFYEKTFVERYGRAVGYGDRICGLKVEDHYFDTADFLLLKQDVSLRARQIIKNGCPRYDRDSDNAELTLKLRTGADERIEIIDKITGESYSNINLDQADLQSLRMAREISGYRLLSRIFKLMAERRTLDFTGDRCSFEVALDDLTYLKDNGDVMGRMDIVEVEQKSGDRESFEPFCESIRNLYDCFEVKKSKYAIGLDFMQRKA